MPRKPTGRGRGRPKGSGELREEGVDQVRLTVRLPRGLYDALEAAAERSHYTREAPELARFVREALIHYLSCPNIRHPEIVPQALRSNTWQPVNIPKPVGMNTRQPEISQEPVQPSHFQQASHIADRVPDVSHLVQEALQAAPEARKTEQTTTPPYDATRFILGPLCERGHDY